MNRSIPDPRTHAAVGVTEGHHLETRIRSCSILVVDDIDFNRTLLGALLDSEGYRNVRFATSGQEALEAVAHEKPDLLILDLMMPGVDGFEVCRRLRQDPATRDLPILVQTALTSSDDRNRAFTSGTTDLVSKPVDRGELLARVRIHLEHRVLVSDLLAYHDRVESELSLARAMYEHLLPPAGQLEALRQSHGIDLKAVTRLSFDRGGSLWSLNRLDETRLAVCLFSVSAGDAIRDAAPRDAIRDAAPRDAIRDAAPRGMAAALHMFRLHTWLSEQIPGLETPDALLARLQQEMGADPGDPDEIDAAADMMSGLTPGLLLAVIDERRQRLEVATAGMPAPLLLVGNAMHRLPLTPASPSPLTGGPQPAYATCACSLSTETVFLFHDATATRLLPEADDAPASRILATLEQAATPARDAAPAADSPPSETRTDDGDFLIVWGRLQPPSDR